MKLDETSRRRLREENRFGLIFTIALILLAFGEYFFIEHRWEGTPVTARSILKIMALSLGVSTLFFTVNRFSNTIQIRREQRRRTEKSSRESTGDTP